MRAPLESAELLAFTRTVQAESLARAARELGLPRATLSRRLARLEAQLGVRLIHRTTRSLHLTEAGQILYGHAQGVLTALAAAEASVQRSEDVVRGPLRVSAPGPQPILLGFLIEFASRHPEVELEVHFTSQHVDLRGGGYDVVLRAGLSHDPGLVGRVLGRTRLYAVASPEYLRQHGTPARARELLHHRCLVGYARGEVREHHWPLFRGGQTGVAAAMAGNDPHFLKAAALAGLGIALLPAVLIREEVGARRLVPVLPKVIGADVRFMVLHVERELVPPAVRAFVSAAVEWAKGQTNFDGDLPPEVLANMSEAPRRPGLKGTGKRR